MADLLIKQIASSFLNRMELHTTHSTRSGPLLSSSTAITSSRSTSTASRAGRRIIRSTSRGWSARRPKCCPHGYAPTSPVVPVTRARSAATSMPSPGTASCRACSSAPPSATCRCRCWAWSCPHRCSCVRSESSTCAHRISTATSRWPRLAEAHMALRLGVPVWFK
jgi:hypothetical protein